MKLVFIFVKIYPSQNLFSNGYKKILCKLFVTMYWKKEGTWNILFSFIDGWWYQLTGVLKACQSLDSYKAYINLSLCFKQYNLRQQTMMKATPSNFSNCFLKNCVYYRVIMYRTIVQHKRWYLSWTVSQHSPTNSMLGIVSLIFHVSVISPTRHTLVHADMVCIHVWVDGCYKGETL